MLDTGDKPSLSIFSQINKFQVMSWSITCLYLGTQFYKPTDMSLPTYHPSDGSLNWARLYIATVNDQQKDPTTLEYMNHRESSASRRHSRPRAVRIMDEQSANYEYHGEHCVCIILSLSWFWVPMSRIFVSFILSEKVDVRAVDWTK